MKYFTPDLYDRGNSADEAARQGIEEDWERALQRYERRQQKIMATLTDYPYGPGPWQMHHGGSLWTYDDNGWFLVKNSVGSEWASQWCADPAKIDSTAARRLPSRGLRPPASAESAAMAVSVSVSMATHAATAPPLAPCTQQGRLVIPPAPA